MDNKPKRFSSYTSEDLLEKIQTAQKHSDLLCYYLDNIRNYNILTDDMLENISNFDDNSKMILIYEYNKVISIINYIIE